MRFRAVSPLLATIILIIISFSTGIMIYLISTRWMEIFSPSLNIEVTSSSLILVGNRVMLSVSVKNSGSKPLVGIIATGYDDGGKCFKIALPPIEPGQISSSTLIIPLGVSNIVLDGSGRNNHGIVYGAVWANGVSDKALYFDGIDDYVNVEPFVIYGWSEITIIEWVYAVHPKANSAWSKFSMIGDYWTDGPSTFLGTNNYVEYTSLEVFWVTRRPDGTKGFYGASWYAFRNQWVNLARRFSQDREFSVWINGIKRSSMIVPSNEKTVLEWDPNTATHPIRYKRFVLGANVGFSEQMKCFSDEVRIYNRALSKEEVAFSSTNPSLPPTGGLVLWLPLDEGSPAPFRFTAGEKYPLTITAYTLDSSVRSQTVMVSCSSG